jgi:outer membrane protein assembly factor BamB
LAEFYKSAHTTNSGREKKMQIKEILLLGMKGGVTAYNKANGRRLWRTQFGSRFFSGGGFVSIVADELCVYACGQGELFCLDLFTGKILWKDGLKGMGYGIATLALPNQQASVAVHVGEYERERETNASTAAVTSSE